MKTVMFMSGAPDSRIEKSLEMAATLGYRSVFCGREDADTRALADAYYISDWTDIGELTGIAEREKADGVIALTDPAVIPAAKTAQALGLPGNTTESLEKLISKDRFRTLQEEAGLFCPKHIACSSYEETIGRLQEFSYPLIVKPVLCSSSFGQTIIGDETVLAEAFRKAAAKSRDGRVCIEEYIEPGSMRTVEADVFVAGDDILWEGLRDSWHRETAVTRPRYDVYPVHMSESEMESFRRETAGALRAAGVCLGEFNVEGFFNREGKFFVVEINARPAGYYNPQHIALSSGVDLTKLLVTTAVGDMWYYEELKDLRREARNILSYSIFAEENGIFDHIHIDPMLEARLRSYDKILRIQKGDYVKDYKTAELPIAQAAFEFDTAEELEAVRKQIDRLVYVVTSK